MEKKQFGKTGLAVSVLGFGAGPIGYLDTEQKQIETITNLLLDSGVNLIDTAAAYHGSEEALGKAIAHRRNEFVLVTKCGQEFSDLPGKAWSKEVVVATVERSLKRLRTDRLDVVLLHSCDLPTLQGGGAIEGLLQAQKAGKVRFLGYSGDNADAVFALSLEGISVVETSINICDQANLDTVVAAARARNAGVIAKRPVANTAWRSQLPGIYQGYAQTYRERFQAMNLRPQDLGFSSEGDWPEIALRFTLSQPGVHTAIVGTTNPENVRRNLAAAAKGPLPGPALERLRTAFKQASNASAERWLGLT